MKCTIPHCKAEAKHVAVEQRVWLTNGRQLHNRTWLCDQHYTEFVVEHEMLHTRVGGRDA